MEFIAYIVLAIALLQFLVSLTNLVFLQKLPQQDGLSNESVSLLIPARNEEANIASLLADLEKQKNTSLEILVYNDQSTDRTEEIIFNAQKKDSRIRLLNSSGLPEGWTGKNHACSVLASEAKGKFLLFLDADVQVSGTIIQESVAMMKRHQLALLSIFPKQLMKTWGEELTVPVMNYVLLTLLPLILVRKVSFSSLSAANGQFLLFNADVYKNLQPHRSIKNKRVEDIEIARLFKQKKEKIACISGPDEISCRMYSSYPEAVNGLSRSVLMFFGNSAIIAVLFWLITTFGFALVALEMTWQVLAGYLLIIGSTRIFISINSNQPVIKNLVFGFVQKINLGIMIGKAIRARSVKKMEWKGRAVPSL